MAEMGAAGGLARCSPDLEVVIVPAFGIEEDIVGLGDRCETCLGAGQLIAVPAEPRGKTEKGLVDLVAAGDTADPEDLVVINHHL